MMDLVSALMAVKRLDELHNPRESKQRNER